MKWLNDYFFNKSSKTISYLCDKFAEKAYRSVEIDSQELVESTAEETLPCDETIVGSDDFEVTLFTPGSEHLPVSVFVICVF